MNEDAHDELLAYSLAFEMNINAYSNLIAMVEAVKEHGYTENIQTVIGEELDRITDHDGPLTDEQALHGLTEIVTSGIDVLTELIEQIIQSINNYGEDYPDLVEKILAHTKDSSCLSNISNKKFVTIYTTLLQFKKHIKP